VILTMSIILVGWFDHTNSHQFNHPFSVVVLLLSIQLVNIATASSCKMLLLLLLILLLSNVSRVASIEAWVLTVGLGIVTQLGRIVPLLVRISVAPVLVLLLDMLTLAARVVALLLMPGKPGCEKFSAALYSCSAQEKVHYQ